MEEEDGWRKHTVTLTWGSPEVRSDYRDRSSIRASQLTTPLPPQYSGQCGRDILDPNTPKHPLQKAIGANPYRVRTMSPTSCFWHISVKWDMPVRWQRSVMNSRTVSLRRTLQLTSAFNRSLLSKWDTEIANPGHRDNLQKQMKNNKHSSEYLKSTTGKTCNHSNSEFSFQFTGGRDFVVFVLSFVLCLLFQLLT